MTARSHALRMFEAAVQAAQPTLRQVTATAEGLAVNGTVYGFGGRSEVTVVGAGKAVVPMAASLVGLLPDGVTARGHVVTKHGHTPAEGVAGGVVAGSEVTVGEGAHPVPDAACVDNAERVLQTVRDAPADGLVVVLITGGGSSLLTLPADGIPLEDYQAVTQLLLDAGATIQELNAVRKHMSAVVGGRLAAACTHTRVLTLVLSDVVGDPVDVIASGPTVGDESTFGDCRRVFSRYGLLERLPASVASHMDAAADETPKPGSPDLLRHVGVEMVGSNRLAVRAAAEAAAGLGYSVCVLSTCVEGEAREVAKVFAAMGKDALRDGASPYGLVRSLPAVLLAGGETTVTIRGDGKGGRNQELALAVAVELEGIDGVTVLACGTDGTDGPTDATGAVVDGSTVASAAAKGLAAGAALENNDAYTFFDGLGDGSLVRTGPTGTNVMDVTIVVVGVAE